MFFLTTSSCSEFTVPEVFHPLQPRATQHPVLHCKTKMKQKMVAVLYSTTRNSLTCVHCPSFFHTSCFQASARGRVWCNLPAGTIATIAYGPLCLWRLNAFGTCHRCKSLLRHLFQCIDDSKKVSGAQSAEGNVNIDLGEIQLQRCLSKGVYFSNILNCLHYSLANTELYLSLEKGTLHHLGKDLS